MRKFYAPRDLAVLAVSNLIWGLGEGLFIFFLPLALQLWNADTVQIGAVLSAIGVTMALVNLPAGYLSDRLGSRPLIRAAFILGVIAAATMAAAPSLTIFVVGLIAYGVTSFVTAPIYSYVTRIRGNWSVQRAVTFMSGSFQVGAILGPMLGGWIGQTAGMPAVFGCSTGLFLVSTLLVFFVRRPPAQEAQETAAHGSPASPLANPRFIGLLVIVFITIFVLSTPQQLTSLYLQDVHNLTLQQVGITGTLAGIGTAVVMFALGNLRPLTGMLSGQLLLGLFSLFMWRGKSPAVFYTGYLFIGGYRLYHSMALAFARPLVKAADVGLAYGLVETGNALAAVLAPLAAGVLYKGHPENVYIVSMAALVVTIALHVFLAPKKQAAVVLSE